MRGPKYIVGIRNFLKSYDFSKGLLLSSAVFIAILFCIEFLNVTVASGAALGVLIISIPDIPGNRKHQTIGMLVALFLAVINFFLIQMALQVQFLVLPVLAILVFANSIISVYGFRASLISFSGLLAMVLSFAHPHTGIDLFLNLLYVTCGGLWYLLLALLLNRYRSQSYLAQLINACLKRTGAYLELRSRLYLAEDDADIHCKILELETSIVNDHQAIRDNLLYQRGRSGYQGHKRKQLLILIELVEILELAAANPIDFSKYHDKSQGFKKVVGHCAAVIMAVGKRLAELANQGKIANQNLPDNLINEALNTFEQSKQQKDVDQQDGILLSNLLDYTVKQSNNVKTIVRYLTSDKPLKKPSLKSKERDLFISAPDYSLTILKENLSFKSPIFKHCLRLVLTVLSGYLLGSLFSIQNAYWIILTIVVIMRPGYVLTKTRSKDRAIGTLLGAVIAFGILFITHDTRVFAALAFTSLTLAFSLIQQNYKAAALFITLTLIFTYSLITTDAYAVIQYRVIDTLMGVLLAGLANYFLWPSWENQTIEQLIIDSIQFNQYYLKEVDRFYRHPSTLPYSYKAARKKAFLAMANLHAGYQRMVQEPLAQSRHLGQLHEVVVINHTLLSAIASLGTYIQIHKTTAASKNYMQIINTINLCLVECQKIFDKQKSSELLNTHKGPKESYQKLEQHYNKLLHTEETSRGARDVQKIGHHEQLKEALILRDQLNWISDISENLYRALMNYKKRTSKKG